MFNVPQKIHLIAIGGAVMHNLAIALSDNGHEVTGSDDEIYEPARSALARRGLLPEAEGWSPERITTDIQCIILGMHARANNPELLKAQALELKILSFPEFIFQHAALKTRIVVGGSHGKTTTTAMLMHVLKANDIDFDYLVGAKLDGFDTMVRLSDAPLMVIEGDEYLSSALDTRPKFLHYRPQIAVLTGIAWDHINVFPTASSYIAAFADFTEQMTADDTLIYFAADDALQEIARKSSATLIPYGTAEHLVEAADLHILLNQKTYPIQVFGRHNLQNLEAAWQVCRCLGIHAADFGQAISSFTGAARRLQLLATDAGRAAYLDFAHAPSKVAATVQAVRERYTESSILAVFELHTYSSMNLAFLERYQETLAEADQAVVFFDAHALALKNMPALDPDTVAAAFAHPDLTVTDSVEYLASMLSANAKKHDILLLMSSGRFGGLDIQAVSRDWLLSASVD